MSHSSGRVARDEVVGVDGGAEACAISGVAELVREGPDDKVCFADAVLFELLGDRAVVVADCLRGERKDEHRVRLVVAIRKHNVILVAEGVGVVPTHSAGYRLVARGAGFCGDGRVGSQAGWGDA